MTRANTEQLKHTLWFAKAGAARSIVPISRFVGPNRRQTEPSCQLLRLLRASAGTNEETSGERRRFPSKNRSRVDSFLRPALQQS
jgi:hypothetical protein